MNSVRDVDSTTEPPTLRVVTGDLFLGGRVAGYGRTLGYQIVSGPRIREEDWTRLSSPRARMIIDLAAPNTNWTEGISRLSAETKERIAAYAPHVRVDLLKAARAAGIAAVFTQSQLDAKIPPWLENE